MNYEIKLEGMEQLRKALADKAKAVSPGAIRKVVKQNTSECLQKAKRNCPVRTGNLQRSITAAFENGGQTGIVSAYMNYAPYVEYGTRFMDKHPFLRPALSDQAPVFMDDLMKLVKKK